MQILPTLSFLLSFKSVVGQAPFATSTPVLSLETQVMDARSLLSNSTTAGFGFGAVELGSAKLNARGYSSVVATALLTLDLFSAGASHNNTFSPLRRNGSSIVCDKEDQICSKVLSINFFLANKEKLSVTANPLDPIKLVLSTPSKPFRYSEIPGSQWLPVPQCVFFDENLKIWSTANVTGFKGRSDNESVCYSTHLTSFASSFSFDFVNTLESSDYAAVTWSNIARYPTPFIVVIVSYANACVLLNCCKTDFFVSFLLIICKFHLIIPSGGSYSSRYCYHL